MARVPLLQLSGISLSFGGEPLFRGLDLVVQPGDRLALVGRNGSGKSTLMKVMAGLVEPDGGVVSVPPGSSVGYMDQHPEMAGFDTLGAFAGDGLAPGEMYRVERAAEGLDFDPDQTVATASGGERRRAALARLMAQGPELMLLDEPTNHLDIAAIGWLERELKATRAGFVLISHDRAFLRELTRATLWLDRGNILRQEKGFGAFEAWRDAVWAEEDAARHKLDRRIKAESRWAVEGISARRRRNMGRVRRLQDMRAERAAQIRRQGSAAMALDSGPKSGRKVIDARGISKAYGDKVILRDLSLTVMRGERVAFVGPNGVGKTTLLKMLLGEVAPDRGSVQLGTGLDVAVFDQARAQLDPDATLWDSLTGDPGMRVSGRSDQVMVRGAPRQVVGYLKDFLFDDAQARAPVRSLSGRRSRIGITSSPSRNSPTRRPEVPSRMVSAMALRVAPASRIRDSSTFGSMSNSRCLQSVRGFVIVPASLKIPIASSASWRRMMGSGPEKRTATSAPEGGPNTISSTRIRAWGNCAGRSWLSLAAMEGIRVASATRTISWP